MTSLTVEKYYPFAFAVIAAIAWYYLELDDVFSESKSEILGSTLTLSAIFTGFLATAKSLILSIRGSQVIQDLTESGYIDDLIDYMSVAVNASLLTCIWALAGYFVGSHGWAAKYGVYGYGWITLCTLTVTSFYRVTNLMVKVIRRATKES